MASLLRQTLVNLTSFLNLSTTSLTPEGLVLLHKAIAVLHYHAADGATTLSMVRELQAMVEVTPATVAYDPYADYRTPLTFNHVTVSPDKVKYNGLKR